MPNQLLIIPPKLQRVHSALGIVSVETCKSEEIDINVELNPLSNQQERISNDEKLSKLRRHSSMRINPPKRLVDILFDWDDEDHRFSRHSTYLQHQRLRYEQPVPFTIEDPPKPAVVSSTISTPAGSTKRVSLDRISTKLDEGVDLDTVRGQTLFHLAAKLGHEEIMRILLNETSHANSLLNMRGQTPLLCAIEAESTSTATLLMEQDPLSLTCKDNIGSSVFHYAAEQSNYIVLSRAISLLKRLSSSAARLVALQRLIEKNAHGKTPFIIAIEKGSLKCVKYILSSKWLYRNVDIGDFINADSLKTTIDQDQTEIASYFVSDIRRLAAIIQIKIDVNDRVYNVLEYSIALKKPEFVRVFISVRIPNEERELYRLYKYFLKHYNVAYSGSNFNQTPIQRMLTMPDMVPLVPLLLEQFIGEDAVDLSIVDDCLRACPAANRCIFGHSKRFSSSDWLKQHPLSLIAEANHAPVYDHDVVKMCVDLKFLLFGNFLYLLILCSQILFVVLYTGIALSSPTPGQSYYNTLNYTCRQLCLTLTSDPSDPLRGNFMLRISRFILLICSCLVLSKEFAHLIVQREKYFRDLFIKYLEIQTHVCAVLFSIDVNNCTQSTGLRCKWQWESGALGIACVWTLLLFVFMNSLKIGKYGLLFASVFLTFLKFCLIYVFVWIGYIIGFYMLFLHKKSQFTSLLYSIPKTLAMVTGEYDFDDLFFPGEKFLEGSEVAMILYSVFVFTMNIVIMNIMVGLAVSDVKSFRLNAKREHLRARIETCLGLQAKFGILCETCSRIVLALSKHSYFLHFQSYASQKYYLWKLELRKSHVDLPQALNEDRSTTGTSTTTRRSRNESRYSKRDHVTCEVGYYRHHFDRAGELLLQENEHMRLAHKVDELRDVFERANTRFHNELRKLTITLQSDLDEIKKKLFES